MKPTIQSQIDTNITRRGVRDFRDRTWLVPVWLYDEFTKDIRWVERISFRGTRRMERVRRENLFDAKYGIHRKENGNGWNRL